MEAEKRQSAITRETRETSINLTINIDGTGKSDISTGIGFLDHMLELFAKHGFFDLTIAEKGDIHVDYHHSMEDLGLALGSAIAQALGNKAGIRRYGSCRWMKRWRKWRWIFRADLIWFTMPKCPQLRWAISM